MEEINYKEEYESLRGSLWDFHTGTLSIWKEINMLPMPILCFFLLGILALTPPNSAIGYIFGFLFLSLGSFLLVGMIGETIRLKVRGKLLDYLDGSLRYRRYYLREGFKKEENKEFADRLRAFFERDKRPSNEEFEKVIRSK